MMERLIRFVGLVQNTENSSRMGIFSLLYVFRQNCDLEDYELRELERHCNWLGMHLRIPPPLKDNGNHRAISWFRSTAKEPLKRIRGVKAILEEYGYIVEQITTTDPGTVIYEDGWQVVAIPQRRKT